MPKTVIHACATLALFAPTAPLLAQSNPWNGVYAGVNVAFARIKPDWSGSNAYQTAQLTSSTGSSSTGDTYSFGTQTDTIRHDLSTNGFGGGARLGFNHQLGNFVLGAEADAALLHLNGIVRVTRPVASYQLQSHISMLETVRARAGLAFGRTMLFATGGVAFTNLRHSVAAVDQSRVEAPFPAGAADEADNLSATARRRHGWAFGGGDEVRLGRNLSLALTALRVDLGASDLADSRGPARIAVRADTRMSIGMLGLNLHF